MIKAARDAESKAPEDSRHRSTPPRGDGSSAREGGQAPQLNYLDLYFLQCPPKGLLAGRAVSSSKQEFNPCVSLFFASWGPRRSFGSGKRLVKPTNPLPSLALGDIPRLGGSPQGVGTEDNRAAARS